MFAPKEIAKATRKWIPDSGKPMRKAVLPDLFDTFNILRAAGTKVPIFAPFFVLRSLRVDFVGIVR